MPMIGLPSWLGLMPLAFHKDRAPAISGPTVTLVLRSGIFMVVLGLFVFLCFDARKRPSESMATLQYIFSSGK